MKKIFTFFVFALCAVCAWAEDTEPKVVDDVYQISTASELTWFASHVNAGNTSANAVLTADIVVNANVLTDHVLNSGEFTQWSPIGTYSNPYHGTFDGQGHTVSGLFNDQGNNLTGFFGHIGDATIKNLGVTDTYFKCYEKSGGIAGFCARSDQEFVFTIENCWFDGLIVDGDDGYNDIGGILGGTWSDASALSRIINCYNLGTISVGYCYNVGGIIGYDEEPNVIVENCYNIGNISGQKSVGSIAGEYCYSMSNCYYLEGTATADGEAKGGRGDVIDSEGEVEAATAEQFASGEICYKLNGDQSSIAFGQIPGSGLPSLTSDAVVYRSHTGCTTYTNNPAEATDEERKHNIILVAEIPVVSGVSHGVVAHYECSVCNAPFADADGKTPLNSESLYLHDFVDGECSLCHKHDSNVIYEIATLDDLYTFAEKVNNGWTTLNAVLTADIVVNENVLTDHVLNGGEFTQWSPIGTEKRPYHGTFDGQGHTVSGLFNNQGNSFTGFFGHIGNATIKNLGVTDTYFKCYQRSGGIAGFSAGDYQYYVFAIENCWFDGRIDAADYDIGGILGGSWSDAESRITNCYNLGTISSTKSSDACVGGITGYCSENTTISNCFNYGEISGDENTGSILGQSDAKVENCYYLEGSALNSGEVSGGIGDVSDSEGVVEAATAEQFASGEICYKLNGDQSSIAFGQILGSGLPSLTSDAVVYRSHTGCTTYTNNPAEATDEERKHNIILVAEIPVVSGVSHGVVAHYKCSVCNAPFADADGKTPLNSESLCLHDFVDGLCSVCHQYDSKFIYEIATLDDLYTFAEKVNNGWTTLNAVLTADIVVNANVLTDHVLNSGEFSQWSPIGTSDYPYHGTFDGQGHTVSGLFNDQEDYLTGFFGHIGNATIKNLGVTDTYFNCYEKSGGIAGFCASDDQYFVFTIENCWFDGLIVNGDDGYNDIGGILGGTWSNESALSRIINCYNLGTISVGYCDNVGGIIGFDEGHNVIVENCYNIGYISGNDNVGSIAGQGYNSMSNCYYLEGTATADGEAKGGIGNISDSKGVVEAATAEQFASGEICHKLNGDQSKIVYHQNLDGSDVAPNFTSKDVVILDGENYVNAPSIPTAVKNINADKREKAIKTIEDGKIVIIKNGEKYDIMGRKL